MPWQPTSETTSNWGRLVLVIGGVDVTYFRDVVTQINSWSTSEPFDDETLEVHFPQITPFEPLPSWLNNWPNVELYVQYPSGELVILWEGLFISEEDSLTESGSGLTIQCIGALYQADLYKQLPSPYKVVATDIYTLIQQAMAKPSIRYVPPPPGGATGVLSTKTGTGDPMLTGYIQDLLNMAMTEDSNQWTLMKDPGRQAVIRLKNRTTVHWTVHVGAPGITHSLSRDGSMATNRIYGEGVDDDQCRWRNLKYPNLHPDDAPVFGGSIINVGESSSDMLLWERRARASGYTSIRADGFYSASEEKYVRQIQRDNGIAVDGDIGPQTWAAVFDVGSNAGNLNGAYFAPLWQHSFVEPYLYNAAGAITGNNPAYDPTQLVVERFINYGERVTKWDGVLSAAVTIQFLEYPASYQGNITLKADPQTGSRFHMRAGQNILLRGHRGVDRMLHISGANINFKDGSVQLTVDEKARDLMDIAEMRSRDRETNDPIRINRKTYRNSRIIEDRRIPWDCENGSGHIPYHATYQKLWNVLRIPAAEVGTIVRAEFTVQTPARFAIAVFDRETTHTQLRSHGSPHTSGYWQDFPGEAEGLIIAWGGENQMGGYFPGLESEGDPLTGRLVDNASWYFESTQPPWLWVAIWVESPTINYIEGRLFPGTD